MTYRQIPTDNLKIENHDHRIETLERWCTDLQRQLGDVRHEEAASRNRMQNLFMAFVLIVSMTVFVCLVAR